MLDHCREVGLLDYHHHHHLVDPCQTAAEKRDCFLIKAEQLGDLESLQNFVLSWQTPDMISITSVSIFTIEIIMNMMIMVILRSCEVVYNL